MTMFVTHVYCPDEKKWALYEGFDVLSGRIIRAFGVRPKLTKPINLDTLLLPEAEYNFFADGEGKYIPRVTSCED